jgi:hypothetical protein
MDTIRRCLCGWTITLAALAVAGAVFAQPGPPQRQGFEERVKAIASSFKSNPSLKKLPQTQLENLMNFMVGNLLFILNHEMAHVIISDFHLPVLGQEEDAADDFAIVTSLRSGTDFSHRAIEEAAKGWFLSELRDRDDKVAIFYFSDHRLDLQRAYRIVCLMVGADPVRFKEFADITKLPESRQEACKDEYEKAVSSWDTLLKPFERGHDQPKIKIDVTYGDGKGEYDLFAWGFRSVQLLDLVAARLANELVWPLPFALEMQTCGSDNATWNESERKLTLCYELAAGFAELYRSYNDKLIASANPILKQSQSENRLREPLKALGWRRDSTLRSDWRSHASVRHQ